ncbi:MAG: transporter substrate-binding domain-containing protein [Candidatus Thiodiazotropha endolucinida]
MTDKRDLCRSTKQRAVGSPGLFPIFLLSLLLFIPQFVFTASTPTQSGIIDTGKVVLSAEERAFIEAHPKIVLGTDRDWRPYVIPDNDGGVRGIEPDLIERINALTGANIQLVTGEWAHLVEKAKAREIDGLAVSARHAERADHFLFSDSPYNVSKFIFTSSVGIRRIQDLANRRVGLRQGNLLEEKLLREIPGISLIPADSDDALLSLLTSGEADAVIGRVRTHLAIQEQMIPDIRLAFIVPGSETEMLYSIRKDWPELVSIINKALAEIPLGDRLALLEKWGLSELKTGEVSSIRERLSEDERAWLDARSEISMCVDPAWMPFEGINAKGEYEGMVADYMALFSGRMGLSFKLVPTKTFEESLSKLSAGECAIVSSWAPRGEMDDPGISTIPYLTVQPVMAVHTSRPFISEHETLAGLRIGAVAEYPAQGTVASLYPEAELVLVGDVDEGIRKLSSGELDVFAASQSTIGYAIQKQHLTNVKLGGVLPGTKQVRTVVNNGEPLLAAILDKVIGSITQEERKRIADRWFTVRFEHGFDYALLWRIIAGFLLVLAAVLLWNHLIRRQKLALARSEEQLMESEKRLRLANKALTDAKEAADTANQAKSVFLANISHELRTPLNAILGFSQLMGNDPAATASQLEKTGIINRSGEHLLAMINDVLDLSKIEAGRVELEPEAVNLPKMLKDIGNMIAVRADAAGLNFNLALAPALVSYVKVDASKLRQILINLLGNAVKFTKEGGVTLRARSQPVASDSSRITLQLEVEDSGPGISAEQQPHIFEPFVQAGYASNGNGTGLGLAITKSFVELMGGEVNVESQLGKGSLFRLELPLALAEATDVVDTETCRPEVLGLAPSQPTWRILVAEDNPENSQLLTTLLIDAGFDVQAAVNGEQAIGLFKEWHPHLIWMDMHMPVMDGYVATKRIRQLPGGKEVKILALTATSFKEHKHRILESGCDDVVYKPYQQREIFDSMAEHLGARYRYADEKPVESSKPKEPRAEALAMLPPELKEALATAATRLEMDETAKVIEQVRSIDAELAEGLELLAKQFRFDEIRKLLS